MISNEHKIQLLPFKLFNLFAVVLISSAWAFGSQPSPIKCVKFYQNETLVIWDGSSDDVQVNRNGSIETYALTDHPIETILSDHGLTKDNFNSLVRGNVLDAGTGGGGLVSFLSKAGFNVHGIDLVLRDFQIAKPDLFSKQDMTELKFDSESFDTILSTWSVLSYESDKIYRNSTHSKTLSLDVLRELKRVLKVGGIILISPLSSFSGFEQIVQEIGGLEIIRKISVPNMRANAVVIQKLK
tara:strand:- start:59 stop:781 length:723 start_codon:yes stop_codon:yes gene_type:complete